MSRVRPAPPVQLHVLDLLVEVESHFHADPELHLHESAAQPHVPHPLAEVGSGFLESAAQPHVPHPLVEVASGFHGSAARTRVLGSVAEAKFYFRELAAQTHVLDLVAEGKSYFHATASLGREGGTLEAFWYNSPGHL
jgi:hypothetical protein